MVVPWQWSLQQSYTCQPVTWKILGVRPFELLEVIA